MHILHATPIATAQVDIHHWRMTHEKMCVHNYTLSEIPFRVRLLRHLSIILIFFPPGPHPNPPPLLQLHKDVTYKLILLILFVILDSLQQTYNNCSVGFTHIVYYYIIIHSKHLQL